MSFRHLEENWCFGQFVGRKGISRCRRELEGSLVVRILVTGSRVEVPMAKDYVDMFLGLREMYL